MPFEIYHKYLSRSVSLIDNWTEIALTECTVINFGNSVIDRRMAVEIMTTL